MEGRKCFPLWLVIAACLLGGCGGEGAASTDWDEGQMARAVWNAQGAEGTYHALPYEDSRFSGYVADLYRLEPDAVSGGMILYAGGTSALEVAVLRMEDESGAKAAVKALGEYIDARAGSFAGYAPEEYAVLEQSSAVSRGQYAALLICPDQEAAQDAFAACFTAPPPENEPEPKSEPEPEVGPAPEPAPEPEPEPKLEFEPEPEPKPEPWSYDLDRLTAAWRNGSWDDLPLEDQEILDVCAQIPALTDGALPLYDRELAVHDWMLAWAEYDPGALSNAPYGTPVPDNDNPYGFLVYRRGICLGYASTFQLLMELCGIECVTVNGASHSGSEEHAWNMVQLEGEWYCVDVTWDDPVTYGGSVSAAAAHKYFNVTSDFLRQTDHAWDEAAFPEATATALAWQPGGEGDAGGGQNGLN